MYVTRNSEPMIREVSKSFPCQQSFNSLTGRVTASGFFMCKKMYITIVKLNADLLKGSIPGIYPMFTQNSRDLFSAAVLLS